NIAADLMRSTLPSAERFEGRLSPRAVSDVDAYSISAPASPAPTMLSTNSWTTIPAYRRVWPAMRAQRWISSPLSNRMTGQARGWRQRDTARTSQGAPRGYQGAEPLGWLASH